MALLAATVSVGYAGLAAAEAISPLEKAQRYAAVKGWVVNAIYDETGPFIACRAGKTVDRVGTLVLERSDREWVMYTPTAQNLHTDGPICGSLFTVDGRSIDSQGGLTEWGMAQRGLTDRMISMLKQGSRLTVDINGDRPVTFSLSGSTAAMLKAEECNSRRGKAPVRAAAPSAPKALTAPRAVSVPPKSEAASLGPNCPAAGVVRSGASNTPATVTFVNQSKATYNVQWIDF